MKNMLRCSLVFLLIALLPGCWIAHTAHDRPDLRANVGRKAVLTEPYSLVRDRGGRLHLTKEEASAAYALIEKIPAGGVLKIKDVVYRISDPGRHDYYVMEIETSSGPVTLEVSAEDRNRPAYRYEE